MAKATVRSRKSVLLPSVQFGNMTLESEVTLEGQVDEVESLQQKARELVTQDIDEQRSEVEKFEREFFKISV